VASYGTEGCFRTWAIEQKEKRRREQTKKLRKSNVMERNERKRRQPQKRWKSLEKQKTLFEKDEQPNTSRSCEPRSLLRQMSMSAEEHRVFPFG
jgi:hypothetical protein